jgi:hypothetical protein
MKYRSQVCRKGCIVHLCNQGSGSCLYTPYLSMAMVEGDDITLSCDLFHLCAHLLTSSGRSFMIFMTPNVYCSLLFLCSQFSTETQALPQSLLPLPPHLQSYSNLIQFVPQPAPIAYFKADHHGHSLHHRFTWTKSTQSILPKPSLTKSRSY